MRLWSCLCCISIEQQKVHLCYLCRNACCLRVTASCSMILSTSTGHLPMYRFRLSTWSVLLTACMQTLTAVNLGARLSTLRLLIKCSMVPHFSNHSLVNLQTACLPYLPHGQSVKGAHQTIWYGCKRRLQCRTAYAMQHLQRAYKQDADMKRDEGNPP